MGHFQGVHGAASPHPPGSADRPPPKRFATLAALAAATWIGLFLPDIDLAPLFLLEHRSIVSHSALAALLLWRRPVWAAGMAVGLGLHLTADCFPAGWSGGALVRVPLYGAIGLLSPLWLGANAVAAFALARRAGRRAPWSATPRLVWALMALTAGFYFVLHENSLWLFLPLAGAVTAAAWLERVCIPPRPAL